MFKYPILISCNRSGSNWVQSYIRHAYQNNYKNTLSFSNVNDDDEFFNKNNFSIDVNDKINFLTLLRKRNYELCHKVHANFLYDKNVLKWFVDFYKGHDIVILKRRNLWKGFLSYLFHTTILNKLRKENPKWPHFTDVNTRPRTNNIKSFNKNTDILKATIQSYDIKFTFDKSICIEYLTQIRYLNTIVEYRLKPYKPQVIYLEDLTDEFLQKRFNVKYNSNIVPLNIKYDIYFKPEELEKLKKFYQIRYDDEFKFYGYEHKY